LQHAKYFIDSKYFRAAFATTVKIHMCPNPQPVPLELGISLEAEPEPQESVGVAGVSQLVLRLQHLPSTCHALFAYRICLLQGHPEIRMEYQVEVRAAGCS